jgi:hypothetical protein
MHATYGIKFNIIRKKKNKGIELLYIEKMHRCLPMHEKRLTTEAKSSVSNQLELNKTQVHYQILRKELKTTSINM